MDFLQYLDLSFYKEIAVINEEHNIFLVQNIKSNKIYIKNLLTFTTKVYMNI